MTGRRAAEADAYARTFYPGTQVLVNMLNLHDAAALDAAERMFTDSRIAEGLPSACAEPVYGAFKAIHHHLFQDLYAWAGKERDYTTGRGPVAFAPPAHIEGWMEQQFARFRAQDELRNLQPEAFANAAAVLIGEINAAHPFIEGNGRVQRIWLGGVAERAGYEFSIRPEDRAPWYRASRLSFEADDTGPMASLILSRIQTLDAAARGANAERAQRFLELSREAAMSSDDASYRAAWLNLDKIEAVARSALPHPACEAIVEKAREQLADHMRAGAQISEVAKGQAWRNAPLADEHESALEADLLPAARDEG